MTHNTNQLLRELCDVFLLLKNQDEVYAFLKDLCTPKELQSFSERWRVCQLLQTKTYSYRDIHQITGASLTTIGRVARFLNEEPHSGYQRVFEILAQNQEEDSSH